MLFSSDYNDELLQNFIAYWTEPNRSKTKLKFELQETFSISRRLKRWYTNQSKYNTQTKSNIFDTWQEARNIINDE